ncbi:AlpA family phage regulatory protein [Fulvivirgaceae bacterium PWU37]|uniref:AlpA family phage regulatory protein n=2 Tax=Dawidia soli TaxID=2782352 RepID=A0AAP2DD66_9BACT|nr:AlpA family phage regulatory protein [Dawidia soli]
MDKSDLEQMGYLRLPEVLKLFPVCRSSWWAGIKLQMYPRPIKLGKRAIGWRKSDIIKLLQNPESSHFQ